MGQGELNIKVRRLAADDLGDVSAIFGWYAVNSAATFEEAPRAESEWSELRRQLDSLGLPFLVAEVDGKVAGYAYAGPWRRKPAYRYTVEDSVFIAPGLTGLGIGRRLLSELIGAATEAGAKQMIAVIAESEADASVGLHKACGFTEAGRLKDVGYKHGRWISTLILQRQIP